MTLKNEHLPIVGMRCVGCETILEDVLKLIPGVQSAKANHSGACVDVRFDDVRVRLSQIIAAIEDKGYAVSFGRAFQELNSPTWPSLIKVIKTLLLFLLIGGVVFWGKSLMPGVMMQMNDPQVGYSMILLVGFLTGFHCIGMCGSFVVSYATASAGKSRIGRAFAHLHMRSARRSPTAYWGPPRSPGSADHHHPADARQRCNCGWRISGVVRIENAGSVQWARLVELGFP